jgi:hypothetical protein
MKSSGRSGHFPLSLLERIESGLPISVLTDMFTSLPVAASVPWRLRSSPATCWPGLLLTPPRPIVESWPLGCAVACFRVRREGTS